jgi:hypothetical protein
MSLITSRHMEGHQEKEALVERIMMHQKLMQPHHSTEEVEEGQNH